MSFIQREPIYIIIPVHNRKNTTLKCLENLQKSGDVQKYYIVVVDDGSTDGTSQAIQSLYPEVTILQGDGNLWWTGGIKKGMEYAYQQGAEYFIWLNDDCLVTEKTLSDSIEFCKKNPNSIVGCQGFEEKDNTILAFGGKYKTWKGYPLIKFPENCVTSCDLLSGNLVCFSREVIIKIGYPEPNELPHYGSDALYLIRARKAKFNIFVDTRNTVTNIFSEARLSPTGWLLKEGEVLAILKLFFVPHSNLHWRIWFLLYWEEYSWLGILLFLYHYISIFIIPVIPISLLRYLPLSVRQQILDFKKKIANA
jgi:glycosyltransferase involved in cell wall biosynthesis